MATKLSENQIPGDWIPAGKDSYINYVRTGITTINVEIYKLNNDGIPELSHIVPCLVVPPDKQDYVRDGD